MARHAKTDNLIKTAHEVLEQGHPMTVRQVYYQLVSRQVTENNLGRYKAVSNALVAARQEGLIPWEWIEDRLRRPRCVNTWDSLSDFAIDAAASYRRDAWWHVPGYFETWLEKDALSGIFEDVLETYRVTLNVGRGYDGWDSIRNAARRIGPGDGGGAAILYFGDFDPSGDDMVESLKKRLAFFGCKPEVVKCALTYEDIERYQLPPNLTKKTDSRSAAFVKKYGDVAVELDALPADVLRDRLVAEVEQRMDLDALAEVKKIEAAERAKLVEALSRIDQ